MGKKETEKVIAVLELLRKQSPLSVKQEKFCNSACVERFLKAKGDSVKKAAKHLRACLSWRESTGTDTLIADEFLAELAEGIAYVAGHDDQSRPVMVFRIKQDYQKYHSQKLFTRLLAFTLEVAIGTMARNVEQFVLLFDASFFRSASAFMNTLLTALKVVADYYPGRLYKAFVIDPPSLFSYLWKGVRPFVELSAATTVVSSLEYEDSLGFEVDDDDFGAYRPRASSLRFAPSAVQAATKAGSSSSSRFTFTVSHHLDSLKPWYLSFADTSASKVGPTTQLGPALISPLNARSLSFASPAARGPRAAGMGSAATRKSLFPTTPLPQPTHSGRRLGDTMGIQRPSFLQSPATFFRRGVDHGSKGEKKGREWLLSFGKFHRRPYDEITYRSMMRPPLGGLVSIVHPQQHPRRRRHASTSLRF